MSELLREQKVKRGELVSSKGRRLFGNKKGVDAWISFVLITLLAVTLGAGFLVWSKGFTASSAADIEKRSEYVTLCESVSLQIRGLCQNTQTLNMNLSNNNNVKVTEIVLRLYDIYNQPQQRNMNITIRPSETARVTAIKQGIVKQLELIPVTQSGKNRVICQSQRVEVTSIPLC